MFYNFKKDLIKHNQPRVSIPQEILEVLNSNLPADLEYKVIGKGLCGIVLKKNSNIQFVNVNCKIPGEYQYKNMNEFLEKIYITQKTVEWDIDKDGIVKINGNEIKISDIIKDPLGENEFKAVKIKIVPPPLPEYKVKLSANGTEKDIILKRQPSNSIVDVIMKNINNDIIDFGIKFNEVDRKGSFSLTVNIDKLSEVDTILDHLVLLSGFMAKSMKINSVPIFSMGKMKVDTKQIQVIRKTIDFWDKIRKLESALDQKFHFSLPLKEVDIISMRKLYYSLIKNKPYKEYVEINEIKGVFGDMKSPTGEEISFSFQGEEEFSMWNIKKTLYQVVGIFNIKIEDTVSIEDGKTLLKVKPVSHKKPYTSTQFFLKKEDAELFCKKIDDLRKAQLLNSFKF